MPTPLTDADKVLRNDVGKRMAVALEAIAEGSGGSAKIEEMTQAEYDALTPAQKADGTLRAISDGQTKIQDIDNVNITTSDDGKILGVSVSGSDISVDAVELTASDIPYSAGVSVADKLDNVPSFDTLTSSDNNKLLGVSVSDGDISVGAVSYMPTMGGRSTTPTSDLTGSLNTPNTLFTENITINSKSTVYFQYRAIMKTSGYTGRLTLVIDNVEVANADMDLTSWMQIIGNYSVLLDAGSHSVSLKLTSTNAGSTATIKAWNTYGYTFIATPTM